MAKPKRYTLAELQAMPTLHSGHFDNLKVDQYVGTRPELRVWLSRMTVEDGAPCNNEVTVEVYTMTRKDGWNWVTVDKYEAK